MTVGTVACSRTVASSEGPPRGIRQSMNPSSCMKATAEPRGWCRPPARRASSGSPALANPARSRRRWRRWRPGRRRAPQHHGVARLEAQPGGIAGHVGPVLVDDPDHAEGYPHPLHRAGRWAGPPVDHLAHRVGQGGHRSQSVGHGPDPFRVEAQAVERGGLGPVLLGRPTSVALASRTASDSPSSRSAATSRASLRASAEEVARRRPAALALAASSTSEGSAVIGTGSW